jgi:hypothetical protein
VSCQPLRNVDDDRRRQWTTHRRYSEFNDLHMTIRKRFAHLHETIHFPSKNFLNNTSADVRRTRQKELHEYLVVSERDVRGRQANDRRETRPI